MIFTVHMRVSNIVMSDVHFHDNLMRNDQEMTENEWEILGMVLPVNLVFHPVLSSPVHLFSNRNLAHAYLV
jgi:hypothetical protein